MKLFNSLGRVHELREAVKEIDMKEVLKTKPCVICEKKYGDKMYKNKMVCSDCLREIKKI